MSEFERFDILNEPLAYVEHRGGIEWMHAPVPRRWHCCRAQTRGLVLSSYVERCACGAIRLNHYTHWMDRNSKKKPSEFRGDWAIRTVDGRMLLVGLLGFQFTEHYLERYPGGVLLHRSELGGEWKEAKQGE